MTAFSSRALSSARARETDNAEEGWCMGVAVASKRWTLRELHSLPDDGNKYELIDGELFVTPAPTNDHETVLALLHRALEPYVVANNLGLIYRARAIVRIRRNEVEPDLYVRPRTPRPVRSWTSAPVPILVVEVLSPSTRRRDQLQKRRLYTRTKVPDYWIVDDEDRTITVARPGEQDRVYDRVLTWKPAGSRKAFRLDVAAMFREAFG
jgi:Uma2 family endonuclease